MKKYLCIGSGNIEAHWLPRWYKVPFEECILYHDSNVFDIEEQHTHLIPLIIRPNGNYDIRIAKTEHLLNGG